MTCWPHGDVVGPLHVSVVVDHNAHVYHQPVAVGKSFADPYAVYQIVVEDLDYFVVEVLEVRVPDDLLEEGVPDDLLEVGVLDDLLGVGVLDDLLEVVVLDDLLVEEVLGDPLVGEVLDDLLGLH